MSTEELIAMLRKKAEETHRQDNPDYYGLGNLMFLAADRLETQLEKEKR